MSHHTIRPSTSFYDELSSVLEILVTSLVQFLLANFIGLAGYQNRPKPNKAGWLRVLYVTVPLLILGEVQRITYYVKRQRSSEWSEMIPAGSAETSYQA